MRREKLYLVDIIEAAKAISGFISGATMEQFLDDDKMKSAVLYKLMIIGEAASKISKDTKIKYPEIERAKMSAFRNIAVHGYFGVDLGIAWTAATHNAPDLKEKVERILKTEFPS
ncbi:MAG: DUF86 domain-containing protein [Nitrospinae bacterium]|nr:DUF86 domain-containing protein [Nitrospinota bacterium]